MIELHQFPRNFGLPNLSPFCMKVEGLLRLAGLEYQTVSCPDPRKAPLGKLPVIVDEGVQIPDSCLIRDHLRDEHGFDLDEHLSDSDKAIAHAFEVMLEERLYWALVYNRWLDENWPKVKKEAFGHLLPVVRDLVPKMVQGKLKRDIEGQGLGLHEPESIYEFARRDLQACADFLGSKPYLMGETISNVDVTLVAFLCGLKVPVLRGKLSELLDDFENLDAYGERLGKEIFPDFFA